MSNFDANAVIHQAVYHKVRVRCGVAVWVELKQQSFNGLQTSARRRFLSTLTTGGLLSHTQAELGSPCSKLQTYPNLNSTHGSTGEKTKCLSPADVSTGGLAKKKACFSAPLSLNSEACIPRDAEERCCLATTPASAKFLFCFAFKQSQDRRGSLNLTFLQRDQTKIRQNISHSSICLHRMWTVMQTVQDILGIRRKPSEKTRRE